MKIRCSITSITIATLFIIGCQSTSSVAPVEGVWDLTGRSGTMFNKGIAVFDSNRYAWIDAQIFRYRYTNVDDRPILHLDGPRKEEFHLVIAHPDTIILSDGLNALGLMVKTRPLHMDQFTRVARRELDQVRNRYGRELGDRLTEGKEYLRRRYQ